MTREFRTVIVVVPAPIYAWDKITQNYTHAEDQCQLSNANITAMKM